MFKQVTTLYIDDTSIKLLVAKGNQVKKWATLPLESGLVKDGVVVDKTLVAAKVKELLKSQKVRGGKVIAGLSGLHCLFRVFRLPRVSEELFAEGISWEAKRLLPVVLFFCSYFPLLEPEGLEPSTFCMPCRRAPNCATAPGYRPA